MPLYRHFPALGGVDAAGSEQKRGDLLVKTTEKDVHNLLK